MSKLPIRHDQSMGDDQSANVEQVASPSIAQLDEDADRSNTKGKPRGRPFERGQSGNPNGRPRGSLNRATVLGQQLLAGHIETIFDRLFTAIEGGDRITARFCASRLVAPQRSRYMNIGMRKINSRADINLAANDVWNACGAGEISIEDAQNLMSLLKIRAQLFDGDLAERVDALESALKSVLQKTSAGH